MTVRHLVSYFLMLLIVGVLAGCGSTKVEPRLRPAPAAARRALPPADPARLDLQARILYVRGLTRANMQDHEAAVKLFLESLRYRPGEAAVMASLSESYAELGDMKSAVYYADQATRIAPDNRYYRQLLAETYLKTGDTHTAEETYRSLLAHSPGNPDALRELARIQTTSGQYADAVKTYEQLIEQVGRDPFLLNQVLDLQLRLQDDLGMERTLRLLIQEEPNMTEYHRMLASIFVRQDRLREATMILEQAVGTGAESYDNSVALADIYRAMGRQADADSLLAHVGARIRTQAPESASSLRLTAEAHVRQNQFEQAADLFYRVLQEEPRDLGLWARTANLYRQAGKTKRAIEVADEALSLFPGQASLLEASGLSLMDAGQDARALVRLNEALSILKEEQLDDESRLIQLYEALGDVLWRMGQKDAARQNWKHALDLNPGEERLEQKLRSNS